MKRIFSILILLYLGTMVQGQSLSLYSNYALFPQIGKDSSLVELYWKVPAQELKYQSTGKGTLQGMVNVQFLVIKGDELVYVDKYQHLTPEEKDTGFYDYTLIDMRRLQLEPGDYIYEVEITDANDTTRHSREEITFSVIAPNKPVFFSDIILLDTIQPASTPITFTRNNLDFVPSVYPYVSEGRQKLLYYSEISSTATDKPIVVTASIKDTLWHTLEGYRNTRTLPARQQNQILDGFNIAGLPAGVYVLHLEHADAKGKILAHQALLFYRSGDSKAAVKAFDTVQIAVIKAFVPYLQPLLSAGPMKELEALAAGNDTTALREWFAWFWSRQDPVKPYNAYSRYREKLAYVQANYKTPSDEGYRSDRGRIYLRYGPPNDVIPYMDEPDAHPYEIWHYFRAGSQNNVRIIFYNPTHIHNEYEILHTELYGEAKNPNWKQMIYNRSTRGYRLDDNRAPNGVGNRLDDRLKQ